MTVFERNPISIIVVYTFWDKAMSFSVLITIKGIPRFGRHTSDKLYVKWLNCTLDTWKQSKHLLAARSLALNKKAL